MLLTRFSLRNRALIALVTVFVMLGGLVALGGMKKELIPSIQIPVAGVVTVVPGSGAGVVEDQVTVPIEAAVLGVEGVEKVESTSAAGVSTVTVNLEYGTDLPQAQARLQRAVLAVRGLPEGADPRVITGSIDDFPVMQIAVTGGKNPDDLARRVKDLVVPELSDVTGVREVQVSGVTDKIVRIDLDEDEMKRLGITASTVTSLLKANGVVVPGGQVSNGKQDLNVEVGSKLTSVEDIRQLPLAAIPAGVGAGALKGAAGTSARAGAGGGLGGAPGLGGLGMSAPRAQGPVVAATTPPVAPTATSTLGTLPPTGTTPPSPAPTSTAPPTGSSTVGPTGRPTGLPTGIPTGLPTGLPTALPPGVTWPEGLPSLEELGALVQDLPRLMAALEQLQKLQDQLAGLEKLQGQLDQLKGLKGDLEGLRKLQGQLDQLRGLQAQLAQLAQLQGQLRQLAGIQGQLAGLAQLQGQLAQLQALQGQLAGLAELQKQLSAMQGGGTIPTPTIHTLDEVADVELVPAPGAGISRSDGKPSVTLAVTKIPAAGAVDVSHAVQDRLDDVQKLVPGGSMTVVFDQAPFIEKSIEDLGTEGMLGLGMAILVVLVFLMSVPLTAVTALSIPMSLLMALIGMRTGGLSLNILTLGALTISVGRVVDDSIVVIENIKRHLDLGEPKTVAIPTAVREVATAITASTAATVAVFLPIGVVGGQAGELFRPFALTVALAMGASLLVALTIIPVLGYWFVRGKGERRTGRRWPWSRRGAASGDDADVPVPSEDGGSSAVDLSSAEPTAETRQGEPERVGARESVAARRAEAAHHADGWLERAYLPALSLAVRKPLVTLLLAFLLLGLTGAAATGLKTDFIGGSGTTSLTISQELPSGTTLEKTDEAAAKLEAIVRKNPEVASQQVTIAGTGNGLQALFMGGSTHSARHTLTLKDDADGDAVAVDLRRDIDRRTDLGTVTVAAASGGPGQQNVEVSVQAADEKDLRAAADAITAAVKKVDGARDVANNLAADTPRLRVVVDREAALKKGMTEPQVGLAVAAALQGSTIGTIEIDQQSHDVVVHERPVPETESDLDALPVGSDLNGKRVRLRDVADVVSEPAPASISRVDGHRTALVTAVPTGNDLGSLTRGIQQAIASTQLPPGASASIGGVSADQQEAFGQLGIAMGVAIAVVYVVMVATFGSLIQPLILLVSIPLAATGALVALVSTGTPLGVPSIIGLLMLVGIVVTNAIVLIDLVNQYRRRGEPVRQAVLDGGRDRVRPIVMTALATILALIPMAMSLSGGGAFISQPLALVVIGGLFSSTALTLLVVPALYVLVEGCRERRNGGPQADPFDEEQRVAAGG